MAVKVGVHLSISGGFTKAVTRALDTGCDCFQMFTGNPRGWTSKPILEKEADSFCKILLESDISPVFAHMPYLPNLAANSPEVYEKSISALEKELNRCDMLKIPFLVTHLGHASDEKEAGKKRVIAAINEVFSRYNGKTMLLLENTAGEKNSVGSLIEDIRDVLFGVEVERTGICFDTCHAFAAGYEMRSNESVADLMENIDNLIGTSRIKLIHLNDAKGECGSGLDRHEHIGLGEIGQTGMVSLLNNPVIRQTPLICETPTNEIRGDTENIRVVREICGLL